MAKQADKKQKSTNRKQNTRRQPSTGKSRSRSTSTRGKRSRKTTPPAPSIDWGAHIDRFLEFMVRDDTVGVIFLALAAITLVSLLSVRGALTEGWIQSLRRGVGVGVWLTPIMFGVTGAWLVLRKVASHRASPWQRIAGLILLFVVFEIVAHMAANSADPATLAEQGGGGGRLGYALSDLLLASVGRFVTYIILLLMTGGGLLMAVGLERSRRVWAFMRGEPAEDVPEPLLINPPPVFAEEPPPGLLQRSRQWLTNLRPARAGNGSDLVEPLVVGSAPTPGSGSYAARPAAGSATARPVTGDMPRQAARGAATPFPRVAGTTPTWQLPRIEDVLDEAIEQELSVEDLARRARLIEDTLRAFGVPVTVVEVNRGPAVTQFGLRPDFLKKRYRKSDTELRHEATQRLRALSRGERSQLEDEARARLSKANNDYPTPEELEGQMLDLVTGTLDKYVEKDVKIKVARIQALSNDLALALEAAPIRIEAPVPGRSIVGLEVPNSQTTLVALRSVMESEPYRKLKSPLKIPLGQDVSGQPAVADLIRMPHLLIAGATGSGKSVCVNSIIASLIITHTPDTLRLLMVDPKMVELATYNGIPHLIAPVVTEVDRVVPVLAWATREMERRYKMFSKVGARNIESFNEKIAAQAGQMLPYIVIIIDELADLMMAAPDEVERYVCRLAQMARATGMHLILATQRPSVDVVTGLIKANFPARVAFAVTSQIDSRVILDTPGAERLLGRGDMLFMEPTSPNLSRLQGCFVSDMELHRLTDHWQHMLPVEPVTPPAAAETPQVTGGTPTASTPALSLPAEDLMAAVPTMTAYTGRPGPAVADDADTREAALGTTLPPPGKVIQTPMFEEMFAGQAGAQAARDALYDEAVSAVREAGRASVSLLQRRLRVGYTRAARLIEMMEAEGIVGPDQGGPRGREIINGEGGEENGS